MNYFAHGARFVDRPYFLAGTAVPDWLSVADRKVRLRSKRVAPFAGSSDSLVDELARGILQHLADDDWFHNTPAFTLVTAQLTLLFREALPSGEGFRPALLGHIVTELLLDSVLIARRPAALDDYYAAIETLDPLVVQNAVNQMAKQTTERLVPLIPLFHRERFLADYADAERLLYRLNQVMRRVTLDPLPAATAAVLETARTIVEENAEALLPGYQLPAAPSARKG
jgi:hypothetical protein